MVGASGPSFGSRVPRVSAERDGVGALSAAGEPGGRAAGCRRRSGQPAPVRQRLWRPMGTTIGVPATGSATTWQRRPNTSATSASVITSAGGPSATSAAVAHGDEVVAVAGGLVEVVEHQHDRALLALG